jgi:hypothetical protein
MDSLLTVVERLITEIVPLLIAVVQVGRISEDIIFEIRHHRTSVEGFLGTLHELLREMRELKSIVKKSGDSC